MSQSFFSFFTNCQSMRNKWNVEHEHKKQLSSKKSQSTAQKKQPVFSYKQPQTLTYESSPTHYMRQCPFLAAQNFELNNENTAAAAATTITTTVAVDAVKKPKAPVRKQICLKNIEGKADVYDKLHEKATETLTCNKSCCLGSIMNFTQVPVEVRKRELVLEQAQDFIEQYYSSIKGATPALQAERWQLVRQSIEATGEYQLTEAELAFGAKLAWRNASRCIGRIQWSKLQLFDCRHVTTTKEMFDAICVHIKYATNEGNIRSGITIFPQRTDALHDYRIWNPQLISYAGYKQPNGKVIGDPINVEFTNVCLKLGWQPKFTEWDILPLVVSANGEDPDFYEYPAELILQVPLTHPKFDWFADLNLRWFAVPAVSNMLFDVGGIQFSACAFNGWYMSTEIGCRNLCDSHRRNMLETVASKMNLDMRTPTSLWKDQTLVEVNIAVLHSYQKHNVTIVDHHTASESFMKHMANETKLRKGCPADWLWIVPPMSASITPVYHQEMALYYLKPSYEYQKPAWRTHIWKKVSEQKSTRKYTFKQVASAVKQLSLLYRCILLKRTTATVLYATETGKSENFARQIHELLGYAFNAQLFCMDDYDFSKLYNTKLLIVVTSTFGNGDSPENGEEFSQQLRELLESAKITNALKTSTLKNISFAVFALGSSTYPNFCAFGKEIDNILASLGAKRLMEVTCGDEMRGQEQSFRNWAPQIYKTSCNNFQLNPHDGLNNSDFALQNETLTVKNVRFVTVATGKSSESEMAQMLSKYHNKQLHSCKLKKPTQNLTKLSNEFEEKSTTILVEILVEGLDYQPGDHVGIIPINRREMVDELLLHLSAYENADEIMELQLLKKEKTIDGFVENWTAHNKIPKLSLRDLLMRFFDITSTPTPEQLQLLSEFCADNRDTDKLQELANKSIFYDKWRQQKLPHLLSVLEEFPTCKPPAALLLAHLLPLQPRFYSISSSQRKVGNQIHLTVGVVRYRNQQNDMRYGVCSNYLAELSTNENLYLFVRSAPGFHLPNDAKKPLILIGPGTGIAPFRSFWQELQIRQELDAHKELNKIWLFFGCRKRNMNLYADEKEELERKNIIERNFLALSRETDVPKTYVQQIIEREFETLNDLLTTREAHIYVCGDVKMAEEVHQTIRRCLAIKLQKTETETEKILQSWRHENRYHEDIFGIVAHHSSDIVQSSNTSENNLMSSREQTISQL